MVLGPLALQLGREERLTLREALGHARRHLVSYVVAPLFPLCAVAVFWLVNGFLGLMMRADAGLLAAGIMWPLVLLGGFLVTLLLAGLLISWPLMWVALSAEENSDAFDALSRSYSYALGRPLHYLGYAALAVAYGLLGWLVVSVFCEAVVRVSEQAVGWAVGGERLAEIQLVASGRGGSPTALMWAGGGLIGLFNGLVRALAMAFAYSFFWHAVSAIYLLLRRHVDETEFDEVFLEDEQRRYGLPELTRDAAGVPGVAETTVDGAADEPPPAGQSTATQPPSDAEESGRSLDH